MGNQQVTETNRPDERESPHVATKALLALIAVMSAMYVLIAMGGFILSVVTRDTMPAEIAIAMMAAITMGVVAVVTGIRNRA